MWARTGRRRRSRGPSIGGAPLLTRALARCRGRPDPGHANHVENRQDNFCGSRHRESAPRDAAGVPGASASMISAITRRAPAQPVSELGKVSVDQSRDPEGYSQKQQHPTDEDG